MNKKLVKTTQDALPVQKKGNRWYNSITQRYVSETYAKRLNSYFLKHPLKTLAHARGHLGFKLIKHDEKGRDVSLTDQHPEIRELLYGKGTQTIRTRTLTGKKIHFSPIHNEILDEDILKHLKKLDYKKGDIEVELYRQTRSKENIYHIFSVNIQQRLVTPSAVDFWEPKARFIFNNLMMETMKIHKKHNLGKGTLIYGKIDHYFYSDLDGWETGKTMGFDVPNRSAVRHMKEQFKDILNWYRNKLEGDTYHNIMVLTMTFYLYGFRSWASELQQEIAKYRSGVTHIPYKESKKEKEQRERQRGYKRKRYLGK